MKIKKGDNVIIIAGADKGKKGTVTKAIPTQNKVIVGGINVKKRARKARSQSEASQILSMAHPIDVSNVKLDK
jgi:large subunit ribosomal protein L24